MAAAVESQRALAAERWWKAAAVRVRMALHAGVTVGGGAQTLTVRVELAEAR